MAEGAQQTLLTSEELRRRLRVALLTPLTVLLVVGGLLALQVARLSENSTWFQHSADVLAKAYETQKLIVDQETGVRGFLLTQDAQFLEPFHLAHPRAALSVLSTEVSDNAAQLKRVTELSARYELWFAEASTVSTTEAELSSSIEMMRTRKEKMDAIRGVFAEIVRAELALREERASYVATSVTSTRYALLFLLAGAAVLIAVVSARNLGSVAGTFEGALLSERAARELVESQKWVGVGQIRIAEAAQGDRPVDDLANAILKALVRYTGAQAGAFFVVEPTGLRRVAAYGVSGADQPMSVSRGEGLVGRAALEDDPLHIRDVPPEYFSITSGTGGTSAGELVVAAARADSVPYAVIELGYLNSIAPRVVELMDAVGNKVALAIRSAEYKARLRELLEESRQQSEELRAQQEELRVANEELTEQSRALAEAQGRLEEQREELTATNERLRDRSAALESSRIVVEDKAAELERASKYKSEFLANMSHELRTPLNSALILAGLLAENRPGNLTPEQVKFANTIHMAGTDLLTLINDILDLSKVEAGHMEIISAKVTVARLLEPMRRLFDPLAREKGLAFTVTVDADVPDSLETDAQRAQQVIKNLLSNAFKFTQQGSVRVHVSRAGDSIRLDVSDTGIGIADEYQSSVFEAFRQADGTTNRKFGGTGLGLTISRDISRLMGGELLLKSTLGQGSVFTLVLPVRYVPPSAPAPIVSVQSEAAIVSARQIQKQQDRRAQRRIEPNSEPSAAPRGEPTQVGNTPAKSDSPLLLVIEDDQVFADLLVQAAEQGGFQGVIAGTAEEGLKLARERIPQAVILDMHLPDHSGLTVLDRLKRDPVTRHIPVHVMSAADYAQQALSMGAIGYLVKPVDRAELSEAIRVIQGRLQSVSRRILLVEDDERQRDSVCLLLADMGAEICAVGTVKEALAQLRARAFDCVVTDLTLPDASGRELIETMAVDESYPFPPVIVYTGRSLSEEEETTLRKHSSSIIVKGARSPERLLDEVALFLHKVEGELPAERQRALQHVRERDSAFEGRTVLIAEDDVRNVFALTALLEPRGAKLRIARNGREAVDTLAADPSVDIVLMDVMMPEMDGLSAIGEIRKQPWGRRLPIIALTAKAMKHDQQACLDAGASDYIAKPLDVDTLLSLMRVWMAT